MERDEMKEVRAVFIAGEIGGAVIELIIDGCVISRNSIIERLEAKCRHVGDVTHRGVLLESVDMVKGARIPGHDLEEG